MGGLKLILAIMMICYGAYLLDIPYEAITPDTWLLGLCILGAGFIAHKE